MSPPLDHFNAWAKEHGVTSILVPKDSKGMGTGLFLNSAASSNQSNDHHGELLFVPNSLILSRSRIIQMKCATLQKTFDILGNENVSERLAIVLFLLFQRFSSDMDTTPSSPESVFKPYVTALPEVSTPVTLDPDMTRGYLAGTLLLDSVCAKRSKLESEFELLSGNLNAFENWPVHPSLDNFIWADATLWSRVLSFQTQWGEGQGKGADDLHLVPFLDFANHATQPNIRWEVDQDGLRVWAKESLLDRVSESEQHHHMAQEHEVYLSYGNKPNTELLFLYGFTLQDNPTQFLTLPIPMDEDDAYYMPKAHTLMRFGIPPRITIYLDKNDGPDDLVQMCKGMWITQDAQYLLWLYSLNEEDGLGAIMELPKVQACVPTPSAANDNEDMEEADLMGEDDIGQLVLTIQGTKITSKELLLSVVPKLEIYPVLTLRSLVLVASRIEFYIARIVETGDKVQKVESIKILRNANYKDDGLGDNGSRFPPDGASDLAAVSRVGHNIGDCLIPTLLEPDHEHPITCHQLEVEMQISSLVSTMKSYRDEEMDLLVRMGNILGDAQARCVEESDFIQSYLSRMQTQDEST
ncbi:hypothetical protein BGZ80_000103 [Entomortierella chlamydospora]|uniref:SET domain-containing protein n=1 Tax=Entomortierella chlamydospora TaxID=101097 RepID=A0A9P6MSP4_9FUNG|nr:hypothetical protein BGZ79_001008 [Entomortierella chlamydospora]KAG0012244.1 hypothetical protein BGZ80_000103 [Entomortierella chlamydospora]